MGERCMCGAFVPDATCEVCGWRRPATSTRTPDPGQEAALRWAAKDGCLAGAGNVLQVFAALDEARADNVKLRGDLDIALTALGHARNIAHEMEAERDEARAQLAAAKEHHGRTHEALRLSREAEAHWHAEANKHYHHAFEAGRASTQAQLAAAREALLHLSWCSSCAEGRLCSEVVPVVDEARAALADGRKGGG